MSHRTVLAPACCLFLGLALLGFALASPRSAASAPDVTATPPIALALGMSHSCALIDGGVRCWGFGPLTGIAGGNDQPVPVQVTGLSSGVQAVVAGNRHTCALLGDATVRCWGKGESGQLGNGASADSATPVAVSGLTGVRKLAAGYDHTCALLDGGGVRCWGLNANGQLGGGDGVGSTSSVPVAVAGLSGALSLTGGGAHTCALMPGGGVKCWGYGFYGSLGNGSTADHNTPVAVTGLTGASQITAGYLHSCALVSGGGVKCWGQFANLWTNVPVAVAGFANPTALAANGGHLCALSGEGGVSCFGANSSGQLGDGTTTDRNAPVPVTDLGGVATGIAAGAGHTCATLADGSVRCWGGDAYGQLGTGNPTRGIAALSELSGSTYSAISVGNLHVCGIAAGGKAQCWGRDYNGELGIGGVQSGTAYSSPQDVAGLSGGVSAIAAGLQYSCAVVNGAAKCWGRNESGILGDGTTTYRNTPTGVVSLGSGVSAIAVSSFAEGLHTCAVASGGAKCWGDNYLGQLGNGESYSTTPRTTPVNVSGLTTGVTAVTAGGRHSCAVVNGAVKCWGYGYYGQLGNGTSGSHTPVATPVAVSGLAGVTALTAGDDFTCAIVGGAAKCWGRNNKGQLGDASWTDRSTPVQVYGLTSGVTSISAWHTQACAVKAGAVYCWGDAVSPYPSSISWAATGYTGAAAGDVRCGWGAAGTTCWGADVDGKLGDGRLLFRSRPAPAIGLKPGAEVFLHHTEAQPGSLVNLRGANFPAWAFVPLRANGRSLGSAQANDKGYLSMVIKTAGAPTGFYQLEALANGIPVAAPLTLGDAAPLRKAEGAGTIIPLAGAVIATPPPPTPTPAPGQQAPAPQISQVTPDRGAADAPAQVEVRGANFQPGAIVRLDGSPAASTLYNSADHLTAMLPGGLAPGLHSITVVNPDWRQVTLPNAYTAILVVASPGVVQQDLYGVSYELTSENLAESVGTPTRIWFTIHRLGGTGALINVPVRFYVGAPGLTDPSTQATYIDQGAAPRCCPIAPAIPPSTGRRPRPAASSCMRSSIRRTPSPRRTKATTCTTQPCRSRPGSLWITRRRWSMPWLRRA